MSLLVDKYYPNSLHEVKYNKDVAGFLISQAKNVKDMSHMIIQGPRGSGKRTLVQLFLKEIYGDFETYQKQMYFNGKQLSLLGSKYHYQFNPRLHAIYDRTLLKLFLEDISYSLISNIPHRIIIIEDADMLSIEAQESLRKTMETSIKTCRFIFICNNEGKLIDPIESRFNIIRTGRPSTETIIDIVKDFTEADTELLTQIIEESSNNMRKVFHRIDLYNATGESESSTDIVSRACKDIVDTIILQKDIYNIITEIRSKIYNIVISVYDYRYIMEELLFHTLAKINPSMVKERYDLSMKALERDQTLSSCSKAVYHLESFCIFFATIVKS